MSFIKNQLVWIIKLLKSLHPSLQTHLCFTIAAFVLKLPPRLKTQSHFVSSPLCCSVALTKKNRLMLLTDSHKVLLKLNQ
jgi:hypothetical protein